MDPEKLSVLLPDSRKFEIINCEGSSEQFSATIRVDLKSTEDIKSWVADISKAMSCGFIMMVSTTPKKAKIYRTYVCNLSSKGKIRPVALPSSQPDLTERNYGCKASMKFWVFSGDDYALRGMAAKVQLDWNHNHATDSAHFMSLLRPLGETKEKYITYFDNGLSINDAMAEHVKCLKATTTADCGVQLLANQSYNPKRNIVKKWYEQWRQRCYGSWLDSLAVLKGKEHIYTEKGVILRIIADPLAILVMTPIMQRAHELPSSSKICFVDSTSTCDAVGHSITFMLAETCIGAVPLAILITSDQTESSYVSAFSLLRNTLKECSFGKKAISSPLESKCIRIKIILGGKGNPSIFLTDDSLAEKKALATVWPNSQLQNCIFHVAQAHWRWLYESKNKVQQEHRKEFMNDFRRIMFSVTGKLLVAAASHAAMM